MTDEIAFELGRNQFPHMFYATPWWSPNLEPFRLVHFFNWSSPMCSGDGQGDFRWSLAGSLKTDLISTDDHRRAYMRGALAGYGKRVSDTLVRFHGANCCAQFRIVERIFHDIRYLDGTLFGLLSGHDVSHHASYTIPICSTLTINSTKEHLDSVFGPLS